jgi:hypothetical protein
MSIHPHDVRELLGAESATTPVSDEQVERMVAVLNACRAEHGRARATRPKPEETSPGPAADRPGESATP